MERIYNQSISKSKPKISLNKELKILQQENLELNCPLIQTDQFNFQSMLNQNYLHHQEALNDFQPPLQQLNHETETSNTSASEAMVDSSLNQDTTNESQLQQQLSVNHLNKNLQMIQEEQTNEITMITDTNDQNQQHHHQQSINSPVNLLACLKKSYEHILNQSPQHLNNLITQ